MSEPLKIYISYPTQFTNVAKNFYDIFEGNGFSPWMRYKDILPGEEINQAIKKAMISVDVCIFFLPTSEYIDVEIRILSLIKNNQKKDILVIPVFFPKVQSIPFILRGIQGINFFDPTGDTDTYEIFEEGYKMLVKSLKKFSSQVNRNSYISELSSEKFLNSQNLLISKIELVNIRCFEELTIDLEGNGKTIQWGMILGENAVGKTTILRSLALGLCDQSETAALMKSVSGGFVRQGADQGYIKIQLHNVTESSEPSSILERLHRALLSAFPTIPKLSSLKIDLLYPESNQPSSLPEQVEALITWAEAEGKLEELIKAAQSRNPDNESLKSLDQEKPSTYTITTTITKQSEDSEIVTQTIEPNRDFLWSDIFVCGYGANRTAQTYTNHEGYRPLDAVQSLFTSQAAFQDPELILLRRSPQERQQLEQLLLEILMLEDSQIIYSDRGIEVEGPWGRQPLSALSDGYRSTSQWLLDFLGWTIHAHRLSAHTNIGGILLIDEIEQHLHPRWQRHIVTRLHQMFPNTQILASTHTPLVAAGIANLDSGMLIKLDRNEDRFITATIINKEELSGKRADQVLTSEAFGLLTSRNIASEDAVDRYAELLGLTHRTEPEEAELEALRAHIKATFQEGETATERVVKQEVEAALDKMASNITPELLDLELNKHLRQLRQENL